jgi:hypothetical protein
MPAELRHALAHAGNAYANPRACASTIHASSLVKAMPKIDHF